MQHEAKAFYSPTSTIKELNLERSAVGGIMVLGEGS